MPPSRRRKSSTGISSLPEPLIVHILSFLGIGDRIRTGVLSRRWQNLWTRVPNLSIRYGEAGPQNDDDDGFEGFLDFVEKTLVSILSNGSTIKSFRVVSPHHKKLDPKINIWTLLATTHGFEGFELDFSEMNDCDGHDLSQYIFRGLTFKELRFSTCNLNPIRPVSWKSLKILSICGAYFGDGAIENILAGSPVLEILELSSPFVLNCLHLGNSSVKKLIIDTDDVYDDFELSAPKLQSLQISGSFMGICKVVKVPCLVEASITGVEWGEQRVDFPSFVRGLLNNLLHVETLRLGTIAIKGIAMLYPEGVLSKCKSLTIDTHMWATEPCAISSLLKSCH